MLTCRQRVHAVLRRSGFDALPWQFDLTSLATERLAVYLGVAADEVHDAVGDHLTLLGNAVPVPVDQTGVAENTVRDEFGVVRSRGEADRNIGDWGAHLAHPIAEPTLAGYRFPDGSAPGRWSFVPEFRRRHADQFLVAHGHGLWEHAWALCGFQQYLEYAAGEPAFVEALTEKLADFSCAVTAQLKGMDVDAIRFGDDWGFQERLMIAPPAWRRLLKKHYRRIYGAARDAGLIVMIHSCGNITEILPDLIDVGVQVVHPLQPEAMDVAYCQRQYGRDLSFWGGLGSQSTLPNGTPDDCRTEARSRLKLFAAGGYILAPAGAAPTETPPQNLAAIVQVARQQFSESGDVGQAASSARARPAPVAGQNPGRN